MFEQTVAYAVRIKDKTKLNASSSGGMFVALSDYIIGSGGAVVSSIYDYDMHCVKFSLITSIQQRDQAIGSKYIQSEAGDIFLQCVQWLKIHTDKNLMFVGLGCQTEGFRKFAEFKGVTDRIYFVDIICHGSPSPLIWQDYTKQLERRYHGKINFVTFKDKRKGWNSPTAVVHIDKKEVSIREYVKVYFSKNSLRPSCYKCPYTTIERQTDMTIGDYWGIEKVMPDFYSKQGNSLILVHTDKGAALFEQVKVQLDIRESNTKDCLQAKLVRPTEKPETRNDFWNDFKNGGAQLIMKKYSEITYKQKIKERIKEIFGR